jgi:hypothetical protein
MATFSLFTSSYTIIQGDVHHIDRSQTTTIMDSLNVRTTLASQSSAPESPLGILNLRCCLKNLTEIRLLWLESTPDDVSNPSASKWHIL